MNAPAELLAVCHAMPVLERAHFLAQCAHESGGFLRLRESLNYSAAALERTWPSRFNAVSARECARQPERIANLVYADRLGNGNEASGDGWRFIGRGYIQLTGRDNYSHFSQAHFGDDRVVQHPELLETPAVAAAAVRWFWDTRRLGSVAMRDDLQAVTRGVNGGLNGLGDRLEWLDKFKADLAVSA